MLVGKNYQLFKKNEAGRDVRCINYNSPSSCGNIVGSILISSNPKDANTAHSRWFVVAETFQENGRLSLREGLTVCKDALYLTVCLWTFKGLEKAKRLHEQFYELNLISPTL